MSDPDSLNQSCPGAGSCPAQSSGPGRRAFLRGAIGAGAAGAAVAVGTAVGVASGAGASYAADSAPPGQPPADSAAVDGAPGRQTRVWVLASRKVTPVTITTGLSDGTWVEVAEGDVQAGDRVVTDEVRNVSASHGSGSGSHGGTGGPMTGMMHMPH